MTIKRFALSSAALCAALALAACGGGHEEVAPANDMTTENLVVGTENMTEVPQEAPPAPRIDNTASELPVAPTPDITADEQTQEDADATGMTARVSRDEAPSNEAAGQPVQ